ncbi:hypothetical protein ACKKD4_005180, partial [Escherichia coli]
RSCSANQVVKKTESLRRYQSFRAKNMINIKFQYIHIRHKHFRLADTDMPRNVSAVSGWGGGE